MNVDIVRRSEGRSPMTRYAGAALAVLVATALRMSLDPILGAQAPYLSYVIAVLAVKRISGAGPAVAASVLSSLTYWYLFLEPRYSFAVSDSSALAGLALFAGVVTWISLFRLSDGPISGKNAADLLAREERDWLSADSVRRPAIFAAATLAIGVLATLCWAVVERMAVSERQVADSHQVLNTLATLRVCLARAQSSERGYLLSGEHRDAEAFRSTVASETETRAALRRLVDRDRSQLVRLNELDGRTEAWLRGLSDAMATRRQLGASAIPQLTRDARDGPSTDRLRATLDALERAERRTLASHHAAVQATDAQSRLILGLGAGSLVVLLILAGSRSAHRACERNAAEKILARQGKLIDLSHDAIIVAERNRRITGWNRGAQEIYGWTEEDALGKVIHEFLQTTDHASTAEIDAVLLREGRWDGELNHRTRDGRTISVESSQVLLRDGKNEPTGILEINRNITDRKQAEEALRTQADLLGLSFDAIIVWRFDGAIEAWNPGAEKLYGYSAQEAIGRVIHDLLPTVSPRPWPEIKAELLDKGFWEGELRHRARNGGEVVVSARKQLMRGANGIERVLETNRDITESKAAEEALRESERRVRRKLDSILSPDQNVGDLELEDVIDANALQSMVDDFYELVHLPTAIVDTSGKVLVKSGWQEICTSFHRVHPDTSLNCVESDTKLAAGIAPGDFKIYRCKNGLWDVATPIVVGDRHLGNLYAGQFLLEDERVDIDRFAAQAIAHGFDKDRYLAALDRVPRVNRAIVEQGIAFLRKLGALVSQQSYANIRLAKSIAELERSQATVRELNAGLERRVLDRTAQLETANKELEAFAYSVSHDLRAPLRGIDGFSLALAEDFGNSLDETARHYLHRIRSEAQRMGLLIDDLLNLSRITRAEMRLETVDLTAVASVAAERLREENPGRTIEFSIERGLRVRADPRLLEVAVTNLLGNAVKFTGTRAESRIAIGRALKNGEAAYFVSDNGVGFDMKYADMLFGAFQRLHRSDEFPGTGIGLATVQRIFRRHGGRIWADAKPNAGATFFFTIEESDEHSTADSSH